MSLILLLQTAATITVTVNTTSTTATAANIIDGTTTTASKANIIMVKNYSCIEINQTTLCPQRLLKGRISNA